MVSPDDLTQLRSAASRSSLAGVVAVRAFGIEVASFWPVFAANDNQISSGETPIAPQPIESTTLATAGVVSFLVARASVSETA